MLAAFQLADLVPGTCQFGGQTSDLGAEPPGLASLVAQLAPKSNGLGNIRRQTLPVGTLSLGLGGPHPWSATPR
jgi:hypothetical protein